MRARTVLAGGGAACRDQGRTADEEGAHLGALDVQLCNHAKNFGEITMPNAGIMAYRRDVP